jgi:seryl-tRNA synthetase
LYNALRATASGIIKKAVCKAAEVAIRQALVQLDQQLTDIKEASDEASRRDDVTRKELVQQRMQQKKDNAAAKKEKAQEVADKRQSQFKIVTARSQELINWESKASYVGKQGVMAEKAQSGPSHAQGWHS